MTRPPARAPTATSLAAVGLIVVGLIALGLAMGVGHVGRARAAADDRPLTILTLSSYHGDLPFVRAVETGIRDAVVADNPRNRALFEYLDSARFDLSGFHGEFAALLDRKYAGIRPDAVILWADAAVGFAASHWYALHTENVLAMEVADDAPERLRRHDATPITLTVPAETDRAIETTLAVAKPGTLVLLGDSSGADQIRYHAEFLEAWRRMAPKAALIDLFDTPLDQVLRRVAALPDGSAIHYGLIFKDERGDPARPADVLARITQVASAPVFSQWDSLMGRGLVGGRMLSGGLMGEVAARVAMADARGDAPALAAAQGASVHRDTFDGTLLKRWGIPESRLPPGSLVINRPADIWSDYREYVVGGVVITSALSLLALLLTRSLRARDRAVAELARERSLLTQRVNERTAELARSNDELEGFAYAIAHDLKAPLRAVGGYVRLLQQSATPRLTDDENGFLGTVANAARRMDGMIQGLLEYARVGRGDAALMEPVPVATVIAEVIEVIQAPILHPGSTIETEIAPDVTTIVANRNNFSRLVQNLVENALKYRHPSRDPLVRVAAAVANGRFHLSVSDNGVGIAPSQRERIFGLFQRLSHLESSEETPAKGFGVGLALCRRIVDTHGGEIHVESAPGEGAAFHVTLPLNHPAS